MDARNTSNIAAMVAQAQQKLEEIKGLQLFGGDALNLSKFEHTFNLPGGVTKDYCFRVVMTPTKPGYTMPIDTSTKPAAAGQFGYMNVERVPKTDGTFEWLVYGSQFDFDPAQSTLFTITYSGAATFAVTTLS